tara:strand:- start:1515 stop:1736 length:222 start_codon:yes stop_codon:yes gene_type:complete
LNNPSFLKNLNCGLFGTAKRGIAPGEVPKILSELSLHPANNSSKHKSWCKLVVLKYLHTSRVLPEYNGTTLHK